MEMKAFGLIGQWPGKKHIIGEERLFFCADYHCDFKRVADTGTTLIQSYPIYWTPNEGADYLDKASQHGLRVLYCLTDFIQHELGQGNPWRKDKCQEIVQKFDSHPALWGWYLLDEPDEMERSVPLEVQKDISSSFRSWTSKPLVLAVMGKINPRGWDLVDFSLFDILIIDCYPFHGTEKPEEALGTLNKVAKGSRKYLNSHKIRMPILFLFQGCDEPAFIRGHKDTKVPLGEIENQFNVIKNHDLFTEGVGLWAWAPLGGDFNPHTSEELRLEIKEFFEKISKEV